MTDSRIQIPAELFALAESSHFEGTLDIGTLQAGPDDYRFDNPIAWNVEITNTGSAFLVEGRAEGVGTCPCARCLEDVTYEFDGEIQGYFLLEGQEAEDYDDEDDIGEDEFEVLPDDHVIDIEPLVAAALIVDAPDQPLCKDDCAGLCPRCGSNLNEGPCDCGPGEEDAEFARAKNPFSALVDYKFE